MAIRRKPLASFLHGYATKARKLFRLGHPLSELDPDLSKKELLLEAPPFEPDLVGAIKLISPQFRLGADEKSRRFWELNQNGLCWGEDEALAPFLAQIPTPKKVLDIGPGMGRSAVFFKKKMGWQQVPFHLYESSGESTRYTKAGPRFSDSFCGNLEALQRVLAHNGIEEVEIFDAAEMAAQVGKMPHLTLPGGQRFEFDPVTNSWTQGYDLEWRLAQNLRFLTILPLFSAHSKWDRFPDASAPHRPRPKPTDPSTPRFSNIPGRTNRSHPRGQPSLSDRACVRACTAFTTCVERYHSEGIRGLERFRDGPFS